MNNTDLVAVVAAANGISRKNAKTYVDTIIENIVIALKSGDEVSLAGFGKFKVKDQPAREGRNPATGEAIRIAASKKAAFSPAKGLKDVLNN